MVKNGCGQSTDSTLILTVSGEVTVRDFLHVDTDSQKLKADQKFRWAWSTMGVASLLMDL